MEGFGSGTAIVSLSMAGFVGLHVRSVDAVWCVGRCFPHLGLADSDDHICICLNVLICHTANVREGLCWIPVLFLVKVFMIQAITGRTKTSNLGSEHLPGEFMVSVTSLRFS